MRKHPPARSNVLKARAEGQAAARDGLAITSNPYRPDRHTALILAWDQGYWLAADAIEEPPRLEI